jgi:hypothetical protein
VPAFRAELTRSRGGPSGASYIVDWNAHERSFAERAKQKADTSFHREALRA